MSETVEAATLLAGEGVRHPQRGAKLTDSQVTQPVAGEPSAQIEELISAGSNVYRSAAEPIVCVNPSNDRASELGVRAGDTRRYRIEESPSSKQAVSQVLNTFITNMRLEKPRVLGFPGNLDFQYSHLAGVLDILVNNVGDPCSTEKSEINSKPLERAVIEFLAELSNARPAGTYGYVTSGGSEANLFGLDRGCTVLPNARIYTSAAAHYSIRKNARLLRKELVTVACDDDGRLDPHALARICGDDAGRGAVVVATVGTTMTGAIDDVAAISESAAAAGDVYVHLDAALSGLLLPFTAEGSSWGFASPAVGSLAVSMHKALGMPVPCAVALCRSYLVNPMVHAEYVGNTDSTLGCSRSGLASVLLWSAFAANGRAGLAAHARTALDTAKFAAQRFADIGANPTLLPLSITVVFDRPAEWVCRKYHLATEGDRAHIVTVGHVTREAIDELCLDILKSLGSLRPAISVQERPHDPGETSPPGLPAMHMGDPSGLPPVKGGFVGRDQQLDRIGALLIGRARLVTLIGPGGIGKTRLAEEAARRFHSARRTPVWFVRLAHLPRDADAVAVREAVTAAVLVDGFVGASAWAGAVQTLSPLDAAGQVVHTMLIVDNCEHVLAGAGAVIADLLDAVPGLTILATSREAVGYIDEQLEAVPPLSANQSLELFRQRAELAGHPITEPGQVKLARQICGHMHGHPLYVRLAAARMFYEPLPKLLEQLSGESGDMRMRWRHGPRIGSDGRHRAIGDVIAWSYELCGDKQRLLFDRLSVFAPGHDVNPVDAGTGGVDVGAELEAIEVVCADDVPIRGCGDPPSNACGDQTRLARTEIRELLERLVEQSLVSVHMTADTVHYFLLESLRLFASDRLAERSTEHADERARLEARHYHHYRDQVLLATEWFGPAEQKLLTWAMEAWSNIRRAIDTSMAAGKPVVGLQICVGVLSLRAPSLIGSLPEIRGRIEQTLTATHASQPPTEVQLAAMALMAPLTMVDGRPKDAEELLERCVTACDAHAARDGYWRDQPETYTGLPAVIDYAWGAELMWTRRDRRAIAVFARAREKFRSISHPGGEAGCEFYEALATGFLGSAKQAMTIAHRHLERTTAAGARMATAWAQMTLAIALTKHGNAEEALQLGRAALAYLLPRGDQWGTIWAVHIRMWSLARLITDQSTAKHTSRGTQVKLATEIAYLAGGVKTQRARLGMLIEGMGPFSDETSAAENIARNVLGQETYADVEKRGARLFAKRSQLRRIAMGTLSINTSTVDHPTKTGTS